MTPTLGGRIQSRLVITTLIGIPLTLLLAALLAAPLIFLLLGLVTAFCVGAILDFSYHRIQTNRWDKDWPPLYFLLAAALEFALVTAFMNAVLMEQFSLSTLAIHFWSIWAAGLSATFHAFHIFKPLFRV